MCSFDDFLKCSVPPLDRREHNDNNHSAECTERSSEIPVFTHHSPGPLLPPSQTHSFLFSLLKAAGRNSPVLDHVEIEVRQASGTECLQQSNNFTIIILFVSFCNLGEGGKNSALVCITHPLIN